MTYTLRARISPEKKIVLEGIRFEGCFPTPENQDVRLSSLGVVPVSVFVG
jgi:hypothetical protein